MGEQTGESGVLNHGVGQIASSGQWVAFCRYHGLRAAGPVESFALAAWAAHLARECIVPTIENRSSRVTDHEGSLTGYFLPIDLWREVRALLLHPASNDARQSGGEQP